MPDGANFEIFEYANAIITQEIKKTIFDPIILLSNVM
jgi:hypothetical protein